MRRSCHDRIFPGRQAACPPATRFTVRPFMTKKHWLLLALALPLALAACESRKEKEARQLLADALRFETAGPLGKAQVLYVRIVMDYPDTEAAIEARKRSDVHLEMIIDSAEKRQMR